MSKKYICHVCGYNGLIEAPWSENGKVPSHNICDCCGVEFGYEDCNEGAILRYRENWINGGCEWFDESQKPINWNLEQQLTNIDIRL